VERAKKGCRTREGADTLQKERKKIQERVKKRRTSLRHFEGKSGLGNTEETELKEPGNSSPRKKGWPAKVESRKRQ